MFFKRYGGLGAYGLEESGTDPASRPLDPVSVQGSLDKNAIASNARFPFVVEALVLITSAVAFTSLILPPGTLAIHYGLSVSKKYASHEAQLRDFGLIGRIERGEARSNNGYFAVPKDDLTSRAIFNGKRLSREFRPPPPVNLPALPAVLREMSHLQQTFPGRVPLMITADLRHWFHQIALAPSIQRFFALNFDNRWYGWRSLPMGFSWSPRIAQSLSWWLVLHNRLDILDEARRDAEQSATPPAFVFLKKGGVNIGLLFVYYDNIVAICYDNKEGHSLAHALRATAASVRATWKMFTVSPARTMLAGGIDFLGVTLRATRRRRREDNAIEVSLEWRHVEKRIGTLIATAKRLRAESPCSFRCVAKGGGLIMWDAYISMRPLLHEAGYIDIIKRNATDMRASGSWDRCSTITQEERECLAKRLDIAAVNEWRSVNAVPEGPMVYMASDASDKGFGWTFLDVVGERCNEVRATAWDAGMSAASTFLQEAYAIFAASQAAVRRYPEATRIVIACDNTAVVHVFENGYSNNSAATDIIRRTLELLGHRQLLVCPVRGIDNVADAPSRLEERICPMRTAATCHAIRLALRGFLRTHKHLATYVSDEDAAIEMRHADEEREEDLEAVLPMILEEDEPAL